MQTLFDRGNTSYHFNIIGSLRRSQRYNNFESNGVSLADESVLNMAMHRTAACNLDSGASVRTMAPRKEMSNSSYTPASSPSNCMSPIAQPYSFIDLPDDLCARNLENLGLTTTTTTKPFSPKQVRVN